MHPNPAFDWTDRGELMSFLSGRAFAHVFTSNSQGRFVVHAPLVVAGGDRLQFHVSRRNRSASHLADAPVLISVAGRDGYQSANWYASKDQVPTWHYETVEIEGIARQLSDAELVDHLDLLSGVMERRLSPGNPWTRAKMTAGKFEAMTRAIVGFEVAPEAVRGTRKFNQHKAADDVAASTAGQRNVGRDDLAVAIAEAAGSA